MGILNKIFNSKKGNYYLELDEAKNSQPVQTVVKTANKVAEVVKEKTAEVAEAKPVQEAVKTASKVTDAAQEKLQSVTANGATNAKSKTSKQNKKADVKSQDQVAAKPVAKAKNSGASSYEPPFWVAAMYKNNSSNGSNANGSAGQTFATDNLMPTVTQYRRRPGPSLNQFKDMVRKSRTPRV